ncbi:MAG: ABC transporter permease, partial [Burkholderiales bacterium]
GGTLGALATFPVAETFGAAMGTLFPVFNVSVETLIMQFSAAAAVGLVAAVLPAIRAVRAPIVEGLRSIG